MESVLSDYRQKLQKVLDILIEDLKTIRTGRATPALLESLPVDAYGGSAKMKLLELASIANESPTSLLITPYDPAVIPDIEKALQTSALGFSAQTQGTRIRVLLPPMSAEQREKIIRLLSQKIEERRVAMRNVRDEARRDVKQMFEAKDITEDGKFRLEKEIDTISQSFMEKIQEQKERKESEIREV